MRRLRALDDDDRIKQLIADLNVVLVLALVAWLGATGAVLVCFPIVKVVIVEW